VKNGNHYRISQKNNLFLTKFESFTGRTRRKKLTISGEASGENPVGRQEDLSRHRNISGRSDPEEEDGITIKEKKGK